MSILDLLLETDLTKIQKDSNKDYEVKRLSKVIGEKFLVNCRALTNNQIDYIGEVSKDNHDMKLYVILEGCRLEGKKFSHKDLMDKFQVATPIDLLNKLFLPGELYELYNAVNELSGYTKDAVKEIKN